MFPRCYVFQHLSQNVGQKIEDFINVPTLPQLRTIAQDQSAKVTFLLSAYFFLARGATVYDKLDISEFVSIS